MHRLTHPRHLLAALIAAVILSACAAPPPVQAPRFRQAGVQMWANAVTDPMQLTGRWTQVAGFSENDAAGCPAGGAEFSQTTQGLYATVRLCLNGVNSVYRGPLAMPGPGQLRPVEQAQAPLNRDWWILWVDADLRTLVLGTPDGSFGVILNRDARLPADRRKAARDILRWNGYDLSRLHGF